MTKLTARTLSKVGLLLVAIGYFMPIASGMNMNVFAAVSNLSEISSRLGINLGFYIFFIYLIFISSVIGGILLILQYSGKSISIKFEWATVIVAILSFLIVLIRLNSDLNELMRSVSGGYLGARNVGVNISEYIGFGGYLIIIGLFVSFLFMIIASNSKFASFLFMFIASDSKQIEPTRESTIEEIIADAQKNGKLYVVTTNTVLQYSPENNYVLGNLTVGDKIIFESVASSTPNWFAVHTLDKKKGWCFAGHLKKE